MIATDLETLRRERDRAVAALEGDALCACGSRSWQGGLVALETSTQCWLHEPRLRRTHLGVARCATCGADEVAKRLVEDDCRACAPQWSEPAGPFTTELEGF